MSVLKQYQIDASSATAIAESLERAIERERLREGEQLPTIRALASDLGVSPTTVNAAYGLLRQRGLVEANRRGGSRVRKRAQFQAAALPSTTVHGLRNLAVANPDPTFLPDLRPILSAVAGPSTYGDAQNVPELIAVTKTLFEADGIDADDIAIVGGALDGIERALSAHLRPGDAIALEDPTYPPYMALAAALDLRVVRLSIDDRGILPQELERAVKERIKAVIVVPRAQNPTGASFDRARALALRRVLATAPDILVIEDDYLSEIAAAPLASICGPKAERWVHVRSVGKLLGPDLRLAFMAGDAVTIARVQARQRVGTGWVSHFTQRAVAKLLGDASVRRMLKKAERTYASRREGLIEALASQGIIGIGSSGLNVWIPLADEAAVLRGLQAAGWAVDAGSRYAAAAPGGIRVTATSLEDEEAHRFAADLRAVLETRNLTLTA